MTPGCRCATCGPCWRLYNAARAELFLAALSALAVGPAVARFGVGEAALLLAERADLVAARPCERR